MPPRKKAAGLVAEQPPVTTRSSRSKTKAAAEAGAETLVTNKSEPTTRAGGVRTGSGSRAMAKKGSTPKELSPPPQTTTITTSKKAATTKNSNEREPQTLPANSTKLPAKKPIRGKAQLPLPPARTTPPTESSAEPEEILTTRSVPNTTTNKEEASLSNKISKGNMRKRTRDVEIEVANEKEIDVTKNKKAKTGALVVGTKKQGTRKYAPFTVQNVKTWFEEYQDEGQDGGNEGLMTPAACNKWMEELGISEESAAFYVLAWKLGAKTMFTLTREEFVEGMKKLGIDSNEKLLDLLPIILDQVTPSFESLDFKSFYKFCFNYGKSGGPPGAKNVELPIAVEFLKVILDHDRYRIDYTPADSGLEAVGGKKTEGNFPHLHTFLEFLQKATKLKVLNRDQWESFLPFNKSIGWGLEGYSEDSAWPSLFDEYAEWKKTTYPETIAQSNPNDKDDKDMIGYAP